MPAFDVTIGDKTYHVEIPDPGAAPLRIVVDGEPFDVAIAGVMPAAATPGPVPEPVRPSAPGHVAIGRPALPVGADGSGEITAPMPGTITSVEVAPGQRVEAGQVVCVLEAMKMKNPIRAVRDGVVAQVAVSPGQTVGHGDLLVRLAES